jgi:hypothetical protein
MTGNPDDMSFFEEAMGDDTDVGPIDLTAILTRRLAWDTLPCGDVPDLLGKLGLTPASEDGDVIEHADSHRRIAMVTPLEPFLMKSSEILAAIVTRAMSDSAGITDSMGDGLSQFTAQNAEVSLCSARAVIAQLIDEGILMYTPAALAVMGL